MSNQSAQAQTVANALSGEKAFETVRFAVTGNENADALAGIQAVLEKITLNRDSPIPHARYAAMLLKYLAGVYAAEATVQEERAKRFVDSIPMHPGAILDPGYPTVPYPPPPYAHPPYNHEWATTGGTSGLGSTAPKLSDGDMLDKINAAMYREEQEAKALRFDFTEKELAHRAAILRDLMINKPPV